MKRIIVSAANDGYYPLLTDLISSIEDGKGESDVAIGVLDVGLTSEQRSNLSTLVQHVVTPNWDYQFSASDSVPQKFRAMTARPHLPKYFPGYDIIMWMDADTWVQQWPAVEYFFDKASTRGLAICQEMHRCYANVYNLNNSRQLFFESLKVFGNEAGQHVVWMPMVNSGVFAMRADCHYWSLWRDTLGAAIQRGHLDHFTEQTALNVCIYRGLPLPYFMPPTFNWVCVHAVPIFDEQILLYVEPVVPHDRISIIHLAGLRTRIENQSVVLDVNGNKTKMNLLYSQWKQYRDQRNNSP